MLRSGKIMPDNIQSKIEITKLIITLTAGILIPIVIFFAGKSIEQTLKDRELALKYVEISVGILTEEPTPETKNLREWAIKNINTYAQIKLDKNVIKELEAGSLPVTRTNTSLTRNYTTPTLPRDIKYIIITDSENPSMKSLKNLMQKGKAAASYHYIIDTDGTVVKFVDEENIAWHAGKSHWKDDQNLNAVSIGIGLVHLATKDGKNWLNLEESHPAVGPDYPASQIDSLINLVSMLKEKYKISLDNILTKQDIAPGRRQTDLYGKGIQSIKEQVRRLENN